MQGVSENIVGIRIVWRRNRSFDLNGKFTFEFSRVGFVMTHLT